MVQKNTVRRDNFIRLSAVLGLLALILLIVVKVDNLLPSFILAMVIYYLFGPPVNSLERMGIPRSLSITILFTLSVIVLTVFIVQLMPLINVQIGSLKLELPRYIEGLSTAAANTENRLNEILNSVYEIDISQQLKANMIGWTSGVFEGLPNVAQNFFTTTLLAPFFAFFMLLDGRQSARSLLALIPNNFFEMSLNLMHQLSEQFGDFIRARLLEAVIVGLVVWGGLEIIDFRFAPLLALFAAMTNLIPYIGPIIGAIPAFAIAFINGDPSIQFLFITVVYGVAQIIDMVFIIPLVVAKIVDLHPVTVVIVLLIGSQLLGVLGMIISIPVASALKLIANSVFTHVVDFRR